ncbi:MAG: biopolymer transporter ExbD [Chthoniobacteraceae bacterium]
MKLSRTVNYNPALFTVIPLVNVLFLLLIFFALSTTFVLQPGISVTLPYSPFTLSPQRNPLIVSITAGPAIFFHDQRLSIEELGKSLANSGIKNRTLIIKADHDTPYDLVIKIMNQGLQLGFSVVLATNEQVEPQK